MLTSRIKDIALAEKINSGQLGWMKRVMPITAYYSEKNCQTRFSRQTDRAMAAYPAGCNSHCGNFAKSRGRDSAGRLQCGQHG